MNIGEAAQASGLSPKTIRYYEQIGLVRAAARTSGNYRAYSPADIQTLIFLRRARHLGFSVEDCRNLVSLYQDRSRASADVKALAQRRIAEIDARMAALNGMRETLLHLVRHCRGDRRPECPIIAELSGEGQAAPASADCVSARKGACRSSSSARSRPPAP
ncbi:MAG: Cu(I)-responsive transcriptional regulator [Alphaproteobacteria bacterium]|nr:Cu(I)-responsive transcriptional regulator [Alphaproteobacteria bacterium]